MKYLGHITSRQNQLISKYAKLEKKQERDKEKLFFFEGDKLFIEAIENNAEFEIVFAKENKLEFCEKQLTNVDCPVYSVSDSVYSKLTKEQSPEGIFTICKMKKNPEREKGIILILDTLQDPGNLGTIFRSADAFLCKKVVCSSGTCDAYSDKVIRASMGSIFRLCIETNCDISSYIKLLTKQGIVVYSSVLDETSKRLKDIDNFDNCAFVIGNEGNGIRKEIIDICSSKVYIPMQKNTCESLNASVAASIILYKASEEKI